VLPLLMIFSRRGSAGSMIGLGETVPVNPHNREIRVWMTSWFPWRPGDFFEPVAGRRVGGLGRAGVLFHLEMPRSFLQMLALSLLLCFFNLIPIPPLEWLARAANLTA